MEFILGCGGGLGYDYLLHNAPVRPDTKQCQPPAFSDPHANIRIGDRTQYIFSFRLSLCAVFCLGVFGLVYQPHGRGFD